MSRISDPRYGVLLTIPGLILLFLLILFPLFYLFYVSFLRYDNIHPIIFYGFKNYEYVVGDRLFLPTLIRTIIFCLGSTALTIAMGLVLALCLNRITKLSTLFRSAMILCWAVPVVLSGFIWRWMFNPAYGVIPDILMKLHLTSEPLNIFYDPFTSMIGVIFSYSWINIPFITILILARLQSIPTNLYDAAKIDGADTLHIFKYISLPLAKDSILVGTFIIAMFSFRTIDSIISMTPQGGIGKSTYVLGYYLLDYLTRVFNFGVSAAVGVIILTVSVSIGIMLIRYMVK